MIFRNGLESEGVVKHEHANAGSGTLEQNLSQRVGHLSALAVVQLEGD